jgi:hypothetical protein
VIYNYDDYLKQNLLCKVFIFQTGNQKPLAVEDDAMAAKRKNDDLQNPTQKSKHWATRNPQKQNPGCTQDKHSSYNIEVCLTIAYAHWLNTAQL